VTEDLSTPTPEVGACRSRARCLALRISSAERGRDILSVDTTGRLPLMSLQRLPPPISSTGSTLRFSFASISCQGLTHVSWPYTAT
jgi:hypothetical protein